MTQKKRIKRTHQIKGPLMNWHLVELKELLGEDGLCCVFDWCVRRAVKTEPQSGLLPLWCIASLLLTPLPLPHSFLDTPTFPFFPCLIRCNSLFFFAPAKNLAKIIFIKNYSTLNTEKLETIYVINEWILKNFTPYKI